MHLEDKEDFLSYAAPVSPGLYAHNPEYFSHFKPRIHKNARIADDASIQCQIDLLGKEHIGTFAGCLNPVSGGCAALTFPFTSPKDLALAAYMSEAAAIYDDLEELHLSTDTLAESMKGQATRSTHELIASLEQNSSERMEQAVAKIMVQLSNQGQRGEKLLSQWNLFKRITQTAESAHVEYESLDQYLSHRGEDFGLKNLIALSYYGVNLTLTAAEQSITSPILQPLYDSIALTNDYFSWEKESSEQKSHVVSSVALFMKWDSLSASEAKEAVKAKIIELEGDYLTRKTKCLQEIGSGGTSQTVNRAFDLIEAIAAGLFLWSMTCPRYHCSSQNIYQTCLENRTKDGFQFFDSCTVSEELLSCENLYALANGTKRMVINGTHKHEVANGVARLTESNGNSLILDGLQWFIDLLLDSQPPSVFRDLSLIPLGHEVLRYPSDYILSMPGKGVRWAVLNAMNLWYQVPRDSLDKIKEVVKLVHTSSLMFDDVQDNSPLRRGKPSAHAIFGVGQTISSGFFLCLDVFRIIQTLSPSATTIYLDELDLMHRGQAYDLYWTHNGICPTEKEYLSMIDASKSKCIRLLLIHMADMVNCYPPETSALFRLASRLSRAEATKNKNLELERHFTLVGRYFQIRDDYQNLTSLEYIDNKGFCEDLDEGKYSLLLIHSLQKGDHIIPTILQQRKISGHLTKEMKLLVLERLTANGSFDYTLAIMEELFELIKGELEALERETQTKNWILWRVLRQLRV
ncbi:hypothetical protein N7532_008861 [Penicillium argentinense]|uniref:Uncharacterized protein n=1 Tax=Penicillium argentinense TaxID=1131581 RepID=A0A9W9EY65_9EURO|nr:uncharacterized protein N7532_008861 [Penicillium argentinense]KAJ5090177.1 hypothetical protein N7532_008861 [Penicillium argentinense]